MQSDLWDVLGAPKGAPAYAPPYRANPWAKLGWSSGTKP